MGSTITMHFVLALLAGGMLLGVSGQADPFAAYGNVHHQRFTFPAYFATASMMPVFIGTGIHSAARAIADIFAPIQQPAFLTVGTSIDRVRLYEGLAGALQRTLEAPGTVEPTAAAAMTPADKHACGLATANITGGNTPAMIPADSPATIPVDSLAVIPVDTPAMIPVDTPVDTSIPDSLRNANAVVLYLPVEVAGIVVHATTSALVPAGKHARTLSKTRSTGGNAGTPAMTLASTPIGTTGTNNDLSNAFAVVLGGPSNLMATTVLASAEIRSTTFASALTTTTSVTGGDEARIIATIGTKPKGTEPHNAPTVRPSPSKSKARLQTRQGGKVAPVVEVPAEFNVGVDSITPVVEGASREDSSRLSPLSLAASVLPLDLYELFVAFNTLDATVRTFLWNTWTSTFESVNTIAAATRLSPLEVPSAASSRGFPYLTPADVRAPVEGLTNWLMLVLSSTISAIEKNLSSSSSWIRSSTFGQDLVTGRDLVVAVGYMFFLLMLCAGCIVGGPAKIVGSSSSETKRKGRARDGGARCPRRRKRGRAKINEQTR